MKVKTIAIFILLIGNLQLSAQQYDLMGWVKSKDDKTPLQGAHVQIAGTSIGTVTGFSGKFYFKGLSAGNYQLMISYVGYKNLDRQISIPDDLSGDIEILMEEEAYLADEAVVSATGIKIARKDVLPAISVVRKEVLTESRESALLPVVNEQVPGVFVTERGVTGFGVAEGAAGGISIRGVGGSPNTGVLVLIDGSPQYMGIFGHPLPDAYVASDAERVEVIRGPASVMYGSNAMAGAINIITKQQQQDGFGGRARISYGSYNTRKLMANAGFRNNKFEVFASINNDHTDGHRENSSFDIVNGYLKLSANLNNNLKISADGMTAQYNTDDPGPATNPDSSYLTQVHWADIRRNMISLSLDNTFSNTEGSLKLFYNSGVHELYNGFHSVDHNYGFSVFQSANLFSGNTISAGMDYKNLGGMAENEKAMMGQGIIFTDTTIYELGGYLLSKQTLHEKWILTAGIRYQYHEISGSEWVPQAGINYLINKNNIVKISASKGFRNPTVRELFMWDNANPNLKPEKMWCYEGGYITGFPKQKIDLEATFYYQVGDNLIKSVGQYPDVSYYNTGEFIHYGIEFSGSWAPISDLKFETNYSWLHMDTPVIAAPEHQWFKSLRYTWNKLQLKISGMYICKLYTSTNPLSTENYYLLNARASYQLFKYMNIWVSAENILDQEYEVNYDYPMPGITFMGGIDLKFHSAKK